jgi:hypothetical protein
VGLYRGSEETKGLIRSVRSICLEEFIWRLSHCKESSCWKKLFRWRAAICGTANKSSISR